MWRKNTAILGWLMLLLSILLSIIFSLCFDRSFYAKEYARYHQAEEIRMSSEDLMKATETLLDYLQDQRDDIVVEAEVNGVNREVFNERETLHMVDVKNLYQNALKWRTGLLIGGAAVLLTCGLTDKRKASANLSYGYKCALILLAVFLAVIGIWATADFDDFWVQFHYLFFDNDLFFLDPATSIMINMFPGSFFSDLVFRIILYFLLVILAVGLLLFLWSRKVKKHD